MMQVPAPVEKPSKPTFWQRWATLPGRVLLGLLKPKTVLLKVSEGVYLDVVGRRVIVEGGFNFHATGNLYLTSDQHVVLLSGRTQDIDRPGYTYSIWNNPDLDMMGRPILKIHAYRNGVLEVIEAVFDPQGNLILPDGYSLEKPVQIISDGSGPINESHSLDEPSQVQPGPTG